MVLFVRIYQDGKWIRLCTGVSTVQYRVASLHCVLTVFAIPQYRSILYFSMKYDKA